MKVGILLGLLFWGWMALAFELVRHMSLGSAVLLSGIAVLVLLVIANGFIQAFQTNSDNKLEED